MFRTCGVAVGALPCCHICSCLLCWFLQIIALVAIQYLQLPALLIFADHCFGCNTIFAVACSADFCRSLLWLRYNICSLLALLIFVDHSFVSFFFPIQPPVFPTPYGSWAKVAIGLSTVPLKTMGPFARSKTSSLPNVVAANSPRWDENRDRGKDEVTESRGELDAVMSR